MMHLDACYDLCNRRYTDLIISPGQSFNEPGGSVCKDNNVQLL